MKFLADENFPRTSYLRIKQAGFDILSVGKDYAGITDESVMRIAIEEGRVILTFDSDFGRLIFEYNHKPESGVVYFRLVDFSLEEPADLLLQLAEEANVLFEGYLTVIDRDAETGQYKIRQRRIPK